MIILRRVCLVIVALLALSIIAMRRVVLTFRSAFGQNGLRLSNRSVGARRTAVVSTVLLALAASGAALLTVIGQI